MEKLIQQADQMMYQDKRGYYQESSDTPQEEQSRVASANEENSEVYKFLRAASYDVETLFQSMTVDNDTCYFYLGDMQKDLFYISDNMRDDFGFSSNLVPGLLKR